MLTINNLYSFEQGIAAWGEAPNEIICDDQFVVFPEAILCFLTVSASVTGSHFVSPSLLAWKPGRLDYDLDDETPWFPAKMREVRDSLTNEQIRKHHLLVRSDKTSGFFYIGEAFLGGCGTSLSGGGYEAKFYLDSALSRQIWLQMGGYRGWLVEINHTVHYVDFDDLAMVEKILAEIPQQDYSHLATTRYEEDYFHLYTNRHRAWLMYLRFPGDSGVYHPITDVSGGDGQIEKFKCDCGTALEFPITQTIERERALNIAREFFVGVQLPKHIRWDTERYS